MKNSIIKDVRVQALKAPLNQPFRIAVGQHDTLDNLLATITLADGTQGQGEAAVATHITGETLAGTRENLRRLGEYSLGRDAAAYTTLSGAFHEMAPNNMAAVAAIEMALFDALTRQAGLPLWRLYGTRAKRLRTDITIVVGSLEETETSARRFRKQGFRAYKIKIGKDEELDLQRVLAVAGIAPGATLILDANQGFSGDQTLKFLKALKRRGVTPALVEQPVPRDDWEGLKRVTRLSEVPICADESVKTLAEAIRAVREKAVDVINIKLMKSGLVQSREIAAWAKASGIGLMVGGMMESSLAMTCSAHLVAGLGGVEFVDLDTPFFLKDRGGNSWLSASGVYDLAQVPAGIGIDIPPAFLAE